MVKRRVKCPGIFFKAPWLAFCIGIIKGKSKTTKNKGKWDVMFKDGKWCLTEEEIMHFILPIGDTSEKMDVLAEDVAHGVADELTDSASDSGSDLDVEAMINDGEDGDAESNCSSESE
jgi:hypothetical protein